jgi:hypothetical protein
MRKYYTRNLQRGKGKVVLVLNLAPHHEDVLRSVNII